MTGSLGALAEAWLERLGDHRSLEFEGRWHTAAELHARAVRLSAGLRDVGGAPGERVVVCMTNCPEVLLAYAALWRAGAVPTPVISAVTPTELRHVLLDAGARAVVASPASLPLVLQAAAGLGVRVVLAGQQRLPGVDVLLAELETGGDGPLVDRAPDDLAALLYTGGTTGRAKGVMLTHDGLSRISQARAQVFATSGRSTCCCRSRCPTSTVCSTRSPGCTSRQGVSWRCSAASTPRGGWSSSGGCGRRRVRWFRRCSSCCWPRTSRWPT